MTWSELKHPQIDYPDTGIDYPETDGKPMAETTLHRRVSVYLVDAADRHFMEQSDAYVAGDLLMYYVAGDPTKSVAPDFFFVRGVPRGDRKTYRIWEEKKGPEVVVEVTSRWTFANDVGKKKDLFERLGVQELFLFDPTEDRLTPPLKGYRLESGAFRPQEPRVVGDNVMLFSKIMGLEIHCRREFVRWKDPRTGKFLPSARELKEHGEAARRHATAATERAEAADQRAEASDQRARAAEAENARLREELKRSQDRD